VTPDALRKARMSLGISQSQAARLFGVKNSRTWRAWEAGTKEIYGPAAVLLTIVSKEPAAWKALRELDGKGLHTPINEGD
jgi:DNA-binding transcriptional regulator YiaG